MSWVENGIVEIFKTMDFPTFLEKYFDIIDRLGNIDMLIHFRITSRGATKEDMCHPFQVGDKNMAIIHNGTINNIKAAETPNGTSDTYVLANDILANLPDGWETNAAIARLLEEFIGWSKVCTMIPDPEGGPNDALVYILNENSGYWEGGIWYSNKSYISYTKPATKAVVPYDASRESYYKDWTKLDNKSAADDYQFWKDNCDGCNKEFTYKDMSALGGQLLCPSCYAKAEREKQSKNTSLFGECTVYRPCACCRTLVDKKELWHLEFEFYSDLDKNPHQLVGFQADLLKPHATYTDVSSAWCCTSCYMELMTNPLNDYLMSIEVLDAPEKYDTAEECIANLK